MESEPLKNLYKSLTGNGALPLAPDDPYYVKIHGQRPGEDPIQDLWSRIDLSDSESVNLLTGFRGNGKSTELKRLKKMLEDSGCQVFLVNMLDYVLMTKPLALSDFILSLMAALNGQIEEHLPDLKPLSQSYWERLQTFLTSEVEIDKIDFGLKGGGATAKIGLKLKTDPEFKNKIQKHLEGHLTRLVEDAHNFVDNLVCQVRDLENDPDKKIVLLVDSLEQIRGVGEDTESIYASVVELFSGQASNLCFPKLHVVYTVPPYLNVLAPNLGRILGGNPTTRWPNIHVRKKNNTPDPYGINLMAVIIEKRFPEWRQIIPEETLSSLAQASGGDLRDFFRLIRECAISLRNVRLSEPGAPLDDTIINRVIRQLSNELLPIAEEDARWMARIHQTKRASLPSEKNLPSLARFLDCNLIMNYQNGEPWYDIHPLLIPELERFEENGNGQF